MEQSKLISGMILKLKVAYPYFFKDLEDEEFVALTKMYQEQIIQFTYSYLLELYLYLQVTNLMLIRANLISFAL